jgi:uncharacterized protein (TIGR03437 family)
MVTSMSRTRGLTANSAALPAAHTNVAYSSHLSATGGAPPYTYAIVAGTLPPGLSLSSSGQISGTVTAGPGAYRFSVRVADLSDDAVTTNQEIDVFQPAVLTRDLAPATMGNSYITMLTASTGTAPYSWSISSGALAKGLALSAAGEIAGTPSETGTFDFTVVASDAFNRSQPQPLTLTVTRPAPEFKAASVVNGASFTSAVAPGALISILGKNLATVSKPASVVPFPTDLADTVVRVNGSAIPLLLVDPNQINAQLPFSLTGLTAEIVVSVAGITNKPVAVPIAQAAPGLFQVKAGQALVVNEDGSVNDGQHPAPAGSIVMMYATGGGLFDGAVADGGTAPLDALRRLKASSAMTIGGLSAQLLFAGAAPGLSTGLVQINVRIPSLAAGQYPVIFTVADVSSSALSLYVSEPKKQ